jgi:hypothetical protein
MTSPEIHNLTPAAKGADQEANLPIPELIGQAYAAAPPALQSRMLAHLLRPLGVLSLIAVANGIFANIRLRGNWHDLHVPLEEAQQVHPNDIIALADHVQQVSVEAVNNLAHLLATLPTMATSAAAALLITVLLKRIREPRSAD